MDIFLPPQFQTWNPKSQVLEAYQIITRKGSQELTVKEHMYIISSTSTPGPNPEFILEV